MNSLLTALKAHVKTAYSGIRLVEVIPHLAAVPNGSGFPSVGLMDSRTETTDEQEGLRDERLVVTVAVYVRYIKEADVIGTAGIAAITQTIRNYFSDLENVGGVQLLSAGPISGITAGNLDQDFIIAKTFDITFFREATT